MRAFDDKVLEVNNYILPIELPYLLSSFLYFMNNVHYLSFDFEFDFDFLHIHTRLIILSIAGCPVSGCLHFLEPPPAQQFDFFVF